ncbi:warA [Symbiodinium sp. CCMP2456]|nr:warA [Symbiodinium sp. CCMP2456]
MGASLCCPATEDCVLTVPAYGSVFRRISVRGADVQSTVHECRYPLWAVKVSDFLRMSGKPQAHSILLERGLLYKWFPGMFLIFVSHQWLSKEHPDPEGHQLEVLQKAIRGVIGGSLQVHEDIACRTADNSLSASTRQQIAEGYIFLDWFAIPQITVRSEGVNEETTKTDAALAVQSIPAYVELSNIFVALVPELTHRDSKLLANYSTWLSRGWCRAELWCRLLSNKTDTTVIVVYSNVQAEFMYPLDWQSNSIAKGEFTVEADRAQAVELSQMALEKKIQHLQERGPLSHHRFYTALWLKLHGTQGRDLQSFLSHFGFDSLQDAARDKASMNALICAVFSGDAGMVRLLAESRADTNHVLTGLTELGYYDSETALMAAMKSGQGPEVLTALIEHRADVNKKDGRGLPPLYMSRTPEHVQVLLDNRAEMPPFVLEGPAAFGNTETVQALLAYRCNPSEDPRASPLHALSLLSRGNGCVLETAKLLLTNRADVNARAARPSDNTMWQYHSARAQVAVLGFTRCSMMTRLQAIAPGISPLGYAALVGHEQLVRLYLEHGAESYPNDGGDLPEDLARNNHHYHLLPLLATFAT